MYYNVATLSRFERRLRPIASRWHGIIPVWAAKQAGIDPSQLRHWAARNPDVQHPAKGIYAWFTDDARIDYRYTQWAKTLAQAGPGSAFWGPSVVELLGLGGWASPRMHVATYKRRHDTDNIKHHHDTGFPRSQVHGLPIQEPSMAIRDALPYMDDDKRLMVLQDAVEQGYLTAQQERDLG